MYLILKKRRVTTMLACYSLLIGRSLAYRSTTGTAAETGVVVSWGLGFQGPRGNTPVVDANNADLEPYSVYYIGDTSQRKVYLTFDCGYEDGYIVSISGTLKKQNVKAVSFVISYYIGTSANLVKRMAEEGHTMDNHTYHHSDMAKTQDKASFEKEIKSLEETYQTAVGQPIKKFHRPPQGKYSKENPQTTNELGYCTIFQSLAYVGWRVDEQPSRKETVKKLMTRIHPEVVILLHSTSKTNAEIFD